MSALAVRPAFTRWAESTAGLYLHDRDERMTFTSYHRAILDHLFPEGAYDSPLPYSRIVWSCPKKSAKSTLAAGLHIWFGLFADVPGEQYVLANDLDGSRNRVFRYIVESLMRNPLMQYGRHWTATREEIRFSNGSIIRAIPADLRGEAGGNQSLTTIDEPWGIIHENGVRLATEFSPVPTRLNSTVFYTGYQGWSQSRWWHDLIDSGRAGEPVPELLALDDGDGNPACWRNGRLFVYFDHKARMPWHTADYLAEQRRVLPRDEYLRTWENRRAAHMGAFCTPNQWERLRAPDLRALHPGDERAIVLGVDAATKADCTALVGCTWNEAAHKVEVVYCRIWQPGSAGHEPEGGPLRLTDTVGPEIVRLHQQFRVAGVYYDPFQMVAVAEMCQRVGVRMIEFPQTGRRVQADTHLHGLIWGGNLAHYGDPELRQHVINAAARPGERGLRIVKELSSAQVDGAVALSMAALGAVELLAEEKRRLGTADNPFYRP